MTELEELKSKYPLALDTIKLPVNYYIGYISDADGALLCETRNLASRFDGNKELQDQIGELIAHLLNQLQ